MMRPPASVTEAPDILTDGALREALIAAAATGRLSDEDIRRMRAKRRRVIASATSLVLLFGVGVGGWRHWPRPGAMAPADHFETALGQTRLVELADGTSIQLSGGTRLDVTLASDHRQAHLASGDAFFDVAHDPKRPFTVTAAATSVRVLGTAFDLGRTGNQVGLAVYRGAVSFAGTGRSVIVKAGYRTRYRDGRADNPSAFDPTLPDWRLGWLDTNGMTLADLVSVLQAQTGATIEMSTAALGSVAVSGRFRLDNPDQLLTAVGAINGFAVRRDGNVLRIVPKT